MSPVRLFFVVYFYVQTISVKLMCSGDIFILVQNEVLKVIENHGTFCEVDKQCIMLK